MKLLELGCFSFLFILFWLTFAGHARSPGWTSTVLEIQISTPAFPVFWLPLSGPFGFCCTVALFPCSKPVLHLRICSSVLLLVSFCFVFIFGSRPANLRKINAGGRTPSTRELRKKMLGTGRPRPATRGKNNSEKCPTARGTTNNPKILESTPLSHCMMAPQSQN